LNTVYLCDDRAAISNVVVVVAAAAAAAARERERQREKINEYNA
jgi:hypothetical protein